MNDSDYRWVDDPAVALSPSGDAWVAWVDQTRKDVFLQRYSANNQAKFPAPINVSKSAATFSWLPKLAVESKDDNYVALLWQEIIFSGGSHGGEVLFASSENGGITFTEPLNLSNSQAGDGKGRLDKQTWDNGSLDLALSDDGKIYAVWTEYEGALWLSRSQDGGRSFSTPTRIAGTSATPARAPTIAVAQGATVHVAWTVGEDEAADISLATSLDGNSFSNPVHVATTQGHSDAPKITSDSAGTVHLVYQEGPSGRSGPYHVLYTRMKSRAAFEPPRRLSDTKSNATESAPAISCANGRVYVLWETHREPGERASGLSFTYSTNGGNDFAAPTELADIAGRGLGSNGSQQGMLGDKLAVNENGALAVVNSTFDQGRASRIWLARAMTRP